MMVLTDAQQWLTISRAVKAAVALIIEHGSPIEAAVTAAVGAHLRPAGAMQRPTDPGANDRPLVASAAARDAQSAALLAELDAAELEFGARSAAAIVARRHCSEPTERESLAQRLRRLRMKRNAHCSAAAVESDVEELP